MRNLSRHGESMGLDMHCAILFMANYSDTLLCGRVEDWRADFRLWWVFHSFRGGPQSGCHHLVSSPRRIERSVRFSRTTLTCALRTTAYETYATETTFRRSRRNR
jgi:hypothetical protein